MIFSSYLLKIKKLCEFAAIGRKYYTKCKFVCIY